MFTDIDYKVRIFRVLVDSSALEGLPSHREAKIQVEKLARMKASFDKKYPPEIVLTLPYKKFTKMRGQDNHLLQQQSKKVDQICIKVIEEQVKQQLEKNEPGTKVDKGKTRKAYPGHEHTQHPSQRLTRYFRFIEVQRGFETRVDQQLDGVAACGALQQPNFLFLWVNATAK